MVIVFYLAVCLDCNLSVCLYCNYITKTVRSDGHHFNYCPSISRLSSLDHGLTIPGTADGDAFSGCQFLGRAGSVHRGADQ